MDFQEAVIPPFVTTIKSVLGPFNHPVELYSFGGERVGLLSSKSAPGPKWSRFTSVTHHPLNCLHQLSTTFTRSEVF